jgi:hypothetical protein
VETCISMLDEAKIDERLSNLERTVAELQTRLATVSTTDWLERITGSISDAQAFDEALQYGRELRASDRPGSDAKPQ